MRVCFHAREVIECTLKLCDGLNNKIRRTKIISVKLSHFCQRGIAGLLQPPTLLTRGKRHQLGKNGYSVPRPRGGEDMRGHRMIEIKHGLSLSRKLPRNKFRGLKQNTVEATEDQGNIGFLCRFDTVCVSLGIYSVASNA